jgi:hypothetical protein
MIASLCWKNNEWVGLSLACAISEVLGCLKTHLTHNIDSVKQTDYVGGFGELLALKISNKKLGSYDVCMVVQCCCCCHAEA